MALEVKVYREVRDYQARVLGGMSWRQLLIVGVWFPVIATCYGVCWYFGFEDLGVVVVVFLALPMVAIGWMRPMGIVMEKYVGYWWAHVQGRKIFTFNQEMRAVEGISSEKKVKGARSKAAYGAFESTN
ncbi:PrgI family protein [Arcanobacterium hippocoleae]